MSVSDKNTDDNKSSFLPFIAYLQIIGIILVVFGHSFHEYPDGSSGTSLTVYKMMHSFRMPLFMFTSGFLMAYTTSRSPKSWLSFTRGKIRRLLVPYTFLTLITYLPRVMMSDIADNTVSIDAENFIDAFFEFRSLTIPFFWFIHSSFTLLVLTYGVRCMSIKLNIKPYIYYGVLLILFRIAYVSDIVIPTFFSLNMTVAMSIFFIAGCIYFEYMRHIDRAMRWESPWTLILTSLVWISTYYIGNISYLCGLAGICMSISVAKTLERYKIRILDHLIGSNYMIFLLSWYINIATQQVLAHFVTLPWWVHTTLSLTCGIYIPWMLYVSLQRHSDTKAAKAAAFLLGQSFKTRKAAQ